MHKLQAFTYHTNTNKNNNTLWRTSNDICVDNYASYQNNDNKTRGHRLVSTQRNHNNNSIGNFKRMYIPDGFAFDKDRFIGLFDDEECRTGNMNLSNIIKWYSVGNTILY